MLHRRYIVLLLVWWSSVAVAQEDSIFKKIQTLPGNFTNCAVDNLGNLYVVTAGNQLKKLTPRGDSVGVFNDVRRYGKLFGIEVSNPLKTLLYYKNFNTIVALDRFMQVRNNIDLRKQNMFKVKAIANAYDNNIWVMDEQDFKLKKIDEQGKVLFETVDWRQLFDTMPSPTQIFDREGYVYLYDAARGFYIFDYYGAFKNRINLTGWQNVEVSGNTLYGTNNGILYTYRQGTFNLQQYKLPAFFGKYTALKAANGKVYVLTKNGIDVYLVK
jgi:hypothetical protein